MEKNGPGNFRNLQTRIKNMKLAIVHDYLTQYGGAERVLQSITGIWKDADIYTSIYDRNKLHAQGFEFMNSNMVYESFLRKFPLQRKFAQSFFLPLYPLAFENFKLDDYNVVISNTSYAAKGVITKPETLHICYCCTPTRHLWYFHDYIKYHDKIKKKHRFFLKPLVSYLRLWDFVAAQRVDEFVAISTVVQKRIAQIYKRDSQIIFPPVDLKKFQQDKKTVMEKDYFLIVSRLTPHKRVDLAIKAFKELKNQKLIIIGDGPMREELQKNSPSNVIFKKHLTDSEVLGYYQNCQAFLYPQEEDFGITSLEAQAAGKPVIGYGKAGLLDTVINGKTGLYFSEQTETSFIKALKEFKSENYSERDCRNNAARFSEDIFQKKLREFISKKWEDKQSSL